SNDGSTDAVMEVGRGVCLGEQGVLEVVDTFDRPGKAFAVSTYAGTGTFAEGFEDKPGKRIPKAGAFTDAGVGHARAEWSIFDAEAKGPNASAGAGASVDTMSARAFAKAELASASASAGPLKATVGLAADTGIGVSANVSQCKVPTKNENAACVWSMASPQLSQHPTI
uniref:Uncharacterized protein n=1 Tax=Monopterus albus TaxID=43700 RepID=A0A3Q3IKN9_MONAL